MKKVTFSFILFTLILLTVGCSMTYDSNMYDVVNAEKIHEVKIMKSGPDEEKMTLSQKDQEELMDNFRKLQCKKSSNQEDRNGWSYFIEFHYEDGKQRRVTLQGDKFLYNSTRYDTNGVKELKAFLDDMHKVY